ncbi:MAG: hypothetical protein AAF602_11070, partial [Myxococcota bacterium]
MRELTVAHATHRCRVVVDAGFDGLGDALDAALPRRAERAILVTDPNVGPHHAPTVGAAAGRPVDVITLPAGEARKTVDTWTELVDRLLGLGIDR